MKEIAILTTVLAATLVWSGIGSAEESAPLDPLGPYWSITQNRACLVWNHGAGDAIEPFTWSGACVDGKAQGYGLLTYRGGEYVFLLIHEAQQGCRDATYEPSRFPVAVPYPSPHRATPAYVVVTSSDLDTSRNKASVSGLSWISRYVFEGGMKAGRRHGHGIITSSNGYRYEGEFVNGQPRGDGTTTLVSVGRYGDPHRGSNVETPATTDFDSHATDIRSFRFACEIANSCRI